MQSITNEQDQGYFIMRCNQNLKSYQFILLSVKDLNTNKNDHIFHSFNMTPSIKDILKLNLNFLYSWLSNQSYCFVSTACHFSKWVQSKNKSGNGFPGQRGLYRVQKYQLEKNWLGNFEF